MPRLFIGSRELDFFNDISRELMKDVIGQKVYYYPLDYARTLVHDVYQEAPEKVFDHPIEIAALVQWNRSELQTGMHGHDSMRQLEVYLHVRDLLHRKINAKLGDFISYGDAFYEIAGIKGADTVFGQIEYSMGVMLTCIQARQDQFLAKILGPTWEGYDDADAVQTVFHQQRGVPANEEGPTGDIRDMRESGVLDEPLDGTMEVSPRGGTRHGDSSFYDE